MKLYEIKQELLNCVAIPNSDNFVNEETGEVIDIAAIEKLKMAKNEKIENIALWIKDLKADAEALKKEKQAFAARQAAAEAKAESLKNYLSYALEGEKFSTERVAITYRNSDSVQYEPSHLLDIPAKFLKYSEPSVDKTAVKQALKAGGTVPYCRIESKKNIQIK
jgi:hypothetical protein